MKKPTLRFRQVFEHPTHFKVVKPLGNPLLIAKKGLSPGTQARLRAFAEGGEVRGYDNGGEVAAPGTYDQQLKETALASSALDQFEKDVNEGTDRATALQSMTSALKGVSGETQNVAMRAAQQRVPAVSSGIPVKVEAQVPASSAEPVVPVIPFEAPEAAPLPPAPPVPAVPVSIMKPERVTVEPTEVLPPSVPTIPAGLVQPKAPTLDVGKLQFAPVAKPTAQVAPGPTAAPEPVAAEEPAPVEEAAPATEAKPPDVLTQLMDQLPGLYKGLETAESNLSARRELIAADEMKAVEKRVNDARAAREQAWNDYQAAAANEKPYLSRGDALSKIGTAVSLAAGAFASGMTGMPNYALQIFNQASAADLERQKENKNSLYHRFVAAGADVKEAEDLVQAFQIKAFASKMEDAARATTNAKARIELTQNAIKMYGIARKAEAEADAKIARAEYDRAQTKNLAERLKLDQDKAFNDQIKLLADIAKDKSRSESDRQRAFAALLSAASRAAGAGAGAGAGRAAAPKPAEENVVDIGGELVKPLITTPGIVAKTQDNLAGRNQVVRQAYSLSELFKRNGEDIFRLNNPDREIARAKVNTLIENYGRGVGVQRAISLNAAKKIEAALADPSGWKSALRDVFLDRPPEIAIEELYKELRSDRDEYLTQKLGSKTYNKDLRQKLYDEDRASLPPQTVKLGGQ